MKHSKLFLIAVLLLLAVNAVAGTRPKSKKATEKTNRKTATVTLVRWPYT